MSLEASKLLRHACSPSNKMNFSLKYEYQIAFAT